MPSKAQDLAEHIQGAVASLPSHLDALCQAIAAKGGPKAPPGWHNTLPLPRPPSMNEEECVCCGTCFSKTTLLLACATSGNL